MVVPTFTVFLHKETLIKIHPISDVKTETRKRRRGEGWVKKPHFILRLVCSVNLSQNLGLALRRIMESSFLYIYTNVLIYYLFIYLFRYL